LGVLPLISSDLGFHAMS